MLPAILLLSSLAAAVRHICEISGYPPPIGFYHQESERPNSTFVVPWQNLCSAGETSYIWPKKINPQSRKQAKVACEACYGKGKCVRVPYPQNENNGHAYGNREWVKDHAKGNITNTGFFNYGKSSAGRISFAWYNQSFDLGYWDCKKHFGLLSFERFEYFVKLDQIWVRFLRDIPPSLSLLMNTFRD